MRGGVVVLTPLGGPAGGIRAALIPSPSPVGRGVVAVPVPAGPADGAPVPQPGSPAVDAGGAVRLPALDVVPQMTGLVVASGAVALDVAARRRALKAYRAASDADEGLRRVPDADEADQVGG